MNIFQHVSTFLRQVEIPYFLTLHGWGHVSHVVQYAQSLGSLFNLPAEDQNVLLFAAALHDVGNGAATTHGVSEKEARKRHHEFSAEMIREWAEAGLFDGILDPDEVEAVAMVCYAHRKAVALPDDQRLRRITILLRVSDGMDIDRRRAQMNDMGTYFESLDLPPDSVPHWLGHRAIEALRIHANRGLVFEFVVTNRSDAAFQVAELSKELAPLAELCDWTVRVTEIS